jgi:hypothetical protein
MNEWLQSIQDAIYNASYGTLSPNQISAMGQQMGQDMVRAHGSPEDVQQAINWPQFYVDNYAPPEGPIDSVISSLSDPFSASGQWAGLGIVLAIAAVLLIVFVVTEFALGGR